MNKVLVDGDVLVYWTAFACQKMRYIYNGIQYDDFKTLREHLATKDLKPAEVEYEKLLDVLPDDRLEVVCRNVYDMIRDETNSTDIEIYLSGDRDDNFRHGIATLKKYKDRQAEKPVKFALAREYWENESFQISKGQEADDDIAIRQIDLGCTAVIATIDKDLDMIPGAHFNWKKEAGYGRKYFVQPERAERWFWKQMLMGDSADNIPGIKGCGPKTAEKLIVKGEGRGNWIDVVVSKYKEQYGDSWKDAINEIGQLLWMRRKPGQLWTLNSHEEVCTQ